MIMKVIVQSLWVLFHTVHLNMPNEGCLIENKNDFAILVLFEIIKMYAAPMKVRKMQFGAN